MHLMMLMLALHGQSGAVVLAGVVVQTDVAHSMIDTIDPDEYTVGPGDEFWFSVQGGLPAELTGLAGSSFSYLTVTPDGYVVVPTVGSYFVSGRTLTEATALVESGFAAHFPGLRASTGLSGVRRCRVAVTGQVAVPGFVESYGSDRLSDLLIEAGGIDQAGSWTRIQIVHQEGDTTEVDITGFILEGSMDANPMLGVGDRVHVPAAERFVTMEGAFHANPICTVSIYLPTDAWPWTGSISGMLEYIPGESVGRFVNRVGGTAPWASREACYIARMNQDSIPVRIPAPLDDPSADPQLLPGDRVVCPGTPPLVAVSGVVASPGVFPHVGGMNAFYYVSQAGGYTNESSMGGTRVVLPDGARIEVDELDDVPPGSTVTVPRKVLVWWQDPLLILTGVASIVLAWRSLD